jgi:hypothetical protein
MADSQDDHVRSRPGTRGAWRLRIHFDKQGLKLVDQVYVDMIAPQSPARPPQPEEQSGTWFEVRDAADDVLAHRMLSDPFQTRAEHHSPDGKIELAEREVDEGEFELLVPATPGATSVVFYSSPREPGRALEGASEMARFELERPATEKRQP